jgi:hypothetical protein
MNASKSAPAATSWRARPVQPAGIDPLTEIPGS